MEIIFSLLYTSRNLMSLLVSFFILRKQITWVKFAVEVISVFSSIHSGEDDHEDSYYDECNYSRDSIINAHPYVVKKYFSCGEWYQVQPDSTKEKNIFIDPIPKQNKWKDSPIERNGKGYGKNI